MAHRAWRAAAAVHARRRLGAAADLGHGHREPGPHGRRLSGGLPHEPGRQQAPDPGRRPVASRATRTSPCGAGRPPTGRSPAATRCRPRPGIPRSRTSTTTASPTSTSARATSRPRTTTPREDPSNLLIGQPDGTFVEGARPPASWTSRRARGAARRRPEPRRPAGPRPGRPARERAAVAEHRARATGESGGRWAAGSASTSSRTAPNHDAIGAWIAVRAGDREQEREVTVGGGHASGQLVPDPLRAGGGRAGRDPRHVARR